ncbi:hypothetical protein [Nitrosopumilus sp.]|uniref:hypothetical protein n=1 Tax=Nitrosopumilus sp. TaxID=2024843 RepID=UPI002636F192|nr:hypothetical protein [Nitrosopumilus sp.]
MEQSTRKLIEKYSPMWTNKQIWEFDQLNEDLTFDLLYVEPGEKIGSWNSKLGYKDSVLRDTVVRSFDHLSEGCRLLVANKGKEKIEENHIPYLMGVFADMMIDEEICLNFDLENDCFSVEIDSDADIIDCKEFFEEFYHLATGFNYDIDTGIPEDETEAEMYLTRLQEEFDEKMLDKLGDKYLPGNNDPDTINS